MTNRHRVDAFSKSKQRPTPKTGKKKSLADHAFTRFARLSHGRGEAPPNIIAKQEDEDSIRITTHPVSKLQEPMSYITEDMMIRVIIVGKSWLKQELG